MRDIQRILSCTHKWRRIGRCDDYGYAVYACECGLWVETRDYDALPKTGPAMVDGKKVTAAGVNDTGNVMRFLEERIESEVNR